MLLSAVRLAAKYKQKVLSDEGNVIYTYSERQISLRNKKKSERLEKLRKGIDKLEAQVKKDLASKDDTVSRTALAVALIHHTFERVGNEESAKEGHVGVTGWSKAHVSFSGGKAKIKYVGKSGVKHEKVVDDATLVKSLKKAYDSCSEGIFEACGDSPKIDAKKVNDYLKDFDITAKDLRGYHANRLMKEHLQKVRKGKLPSDPKDKEKKLKEEWKEALELTAEAVGHEPATLKNQYLVPGLEDDFMADGTVDQKMTKSAAEHIAARFFGVSTEEFRARRLMQRVAEKAPWTLAHVNSWKSDLRVLLKVYKGVDDEAEFEKAKRAFVVFRRNFNDWVYKVVLPKAPEQTIVERDVAKTVWDLYSALDSYTLFPTYSGTQIADVQRVINEKDKTVARVQRYATKAFKELEMLAEFRTDKQRERHSQEVYHIAGMTVYVEGHHDKDGDREESIDAYLRKLQSLVARVEKHFPGAAKGVTVQVSFSHKEDAEVAATYTPSTDTLMLTRMGLNGGDGHGTFDHEIGHRYWFRVVPPQGRAHWEEVMTARGFKIERKDIEDFVKVFDFDQTGGLADKLRWSDNRKQFAESHGKDPEQAAKFRELARIPPGIHMNGRPTSKQYEEQLIRLMEGEPVLMEELTDYAASGGPIEAFADAFREWTTKGPGALGPATRALFKDVAGI